MLYMFFCCALFARQLLNANHDFICLYAAILQLQRLTRYAAPKLVSVEIFSNLKKKGNKTLIALARNYIVFTNMKRIYT